MPHFYGAVGAPILGGGHQWRPYSKRPLVIGSGRGARDARVLLQDLRKGEPRPEYGLRATATALTVLIHALVVFLVAVHPPAYTPPTDLQEQMASTEVRLIDKEKPPPPPPPPIKLPKRAKKTPAPTKPPARVKEAPEAAMPPIPQVTQSTPELELQGAVPEIQPTLQAPAPTPPTETSPPTDDSMADIEIATDLPRVIPEPSDMALPTPEVRGEGPALRVEAPATPMQPVETPHVDTRVEIGKPALEVSDATVVERRRMARVTADMSIPDVPSSHPASPEVSVTPDRAVQPDIAVEPVHVQPMQAASAQLASVPESMAIATTPALDLPVADVAEAQAPRVQMPARRADVSAPASAASVAGPETDEGHEKDEESATDRVSETQASQQASAASDSDSWLPADDRFQPSSGEGGGAAESGGNGSGDKKGYVQLAPRGNSDVMRRSSDKLGYTPTLFDQYWAPKNESLLDTFLRQVVEKMTVKHTFHLAPGVRVHCVMGPMALFIGCGGDPPRQKSSKSNDQRLNMAPADPLVPNPGAPSPAMNSTAPGVQLDNDIRCSTARVAGSPPPPGCDKAPVKPSQSDQWYPSGGR